MPGMTPARKAPPIPRTHTNTKAALSQTTSPAAATSAAEGMQGMPGMIPVGKAADTPGRPANAAAPRGRGGFGGGGGVRCCCWLAAAAAAAAAREERSRGATCCKAQNQNH
eukprot:1149400-Pelagomonas_calceolata.AAC.3